MKRQVGFTLLEVLIALVILAIALVGVTQIVGQSILHKERVKQKLAAHQVALNVLAELQVGIISLESQSALTGVSHEFNEEWHWKVTATPQKTIKDTQVVIEVQNSLQEVREKFTGYVQ